MIEVETQPEPQAQTQKAVRRKGDVGVAASKPDKIRVELNIEKWPSIWQPAKSNSESAVRTFEREMSLEDGSRATAKIEIGYTQFGTLTTEDQRMFYALIQQWEDAGKPAGRPVYFSDRGLSRKLRKRGWGTNVIQAMTGSLRRLRTTPLRWLNSFHKNDGSGQAYETETPFQILNNLKIITRKQDGHITNQQGYFQFDRNIEMNLLTNYTKPFLPDEFYKLQSEIAQLMYTHVDLVMTDKTRYERCSKDLFYDLGLTQPSYRYPSIRKQKLVKAVKELEGIRLNHGTLRSVTIERTKDGKDFKVVFQKGSAKAAPEEMIAPVPEIAPEIIVNHYSEQKDALQLQAEELLQHFYQIFHGVEHRGPESKQVAQAITLIVQHGYELARYIIEFSHRAAQETNYRPQTFGGILQYTSRATAQFERRSAARQQREKHPDLPAATAGEVDARASDGLLDALSEEDRLELHAKVKKDILEHNPFIARNGGGDSIIVEAMIRGEMLKQLQANEENKAEVVSAGALLTAEGDSNLREQDAAPGASTSNPEISATGNAIEPPQPSEKSEAD